MFYLKIQEMKKICIFIILSFLALSVFAQKAEKGKKTADVFKKSAVVKAYRTCMKEKNYAKAKQTLDEAVKKYGEAKEDAQLYHYKMEALNELIGLENRKIYLKSNPDTIGYFNYMYELYVTGLACDSLEQKAIARKRDMGKKAEPKLRKGVGTTMLAYRKNILNAGKFYYKKRNYKDAFRFLNMYAQTKSSDIFVDSKGVSILEDPDDMTEVSVLAALSAYGSGDYRSVIGYLPESLNDKNYKSQLLEIGSKAYAELGDTTQMLSVLEEGFRLYPDTDYFFVTLTKSYNDRGEFEKALQKAERMTELYPNNRDYWFMRGTEQALTGKKEDALASFGKCIEIKADDAEAFSSIGNIYLSEAHEAYAQFDLPRTDSNYTKKKQAINDLYKKAKTAFEQAKKFNEANQTLWLSGLREAYFKLNRGRELRALEKYKQETGH